MGQLQRAEAILIKTINTGETSKLVNFFTREEGLIKCNAKGARKSRNRFGASLELFSWVNIISYRKEGQEIFTLTTCDLIEHLLYPTSGAIRLAYASIPLELINRYMPLHQSNEDLFDLLQNTLTIMKHSEFNKLPLILWYFLLHFTMLSGYQPCFTMCNNCSTKRRKKKYFFDITQGGLVCQDCRGKDSFKVKSDILRLLYYLQIGSIKKLPEHNIAHSEWHFITELLINFIRFHNEDIRELKSLKFLKKVDKKII